MASKLKIKTMKYCRPCNKTKKINDFNLDRSSDDGRHEVCAIHQARILSKVSKSVHDYELSNLKDISSLIFDSSRPDNDILKRLDTETIPSQFKSLMHDQKALMAEMALI